MASRTRSPFDRMSDDLLLEVFSNLSTIEISLRVLPVCRRWHHVGQNTQLWTHIALSDRSVKLPFLGRGYSTLLKVIRRASMLQCISCPKIKCGDGNEMVCVLAKNCPDLRKLCLPYFIVKTWAIKVLVAKCPHLATVEISVDTIDETKPLITLANLKVLRVKAMGIKPPTPAVSFQACRDIGDNCSQLTGLHIEKVVVSERTVELLVTSLGSQLTELSLHLNHPEENTLLALVKHCINLEHLYLNFEKLTKDDKLGPIRSLGKLKYLKIKCKKLIAYKPLACLFKDGKFKSLESLKFSFRLIPAEGGGDKLLAAVTESCRNLVRVNLCNLEDVTDDGLIYFFEKCNQLKVVVLSHTGPDVTGLCLSAVLPKDLVKVEYIKLRHCYGIQRYDTRRLGSEYPHIDILIFKNKATELNDICDIKNCYVG